MKFLIIQRIKDSFYSLPQDKQANIIAAAFAYVDKYLKSGKCKESYLFPDFKGNVSIWDFGSAEELARLNLEYPFRQFAEYERIPLLEYNAGSKIMKEAMEVRQKAAKK
jgi:hypothetical protein